MGLKDFPTRGKAAVYDTDGTTRVPDSIRKSDDFSVEKGDDLHWVKIPEEDYARVYLDNDKEQMEKDFEDS